MKNYRLAPTDLANLLFRDYSVKRRKLSEALEPKVIPYTYNPFRQTVGDAVNLQFEMLELELMPTPWETLEQEVVRACRGNGEYARVNIPIARATHKYAQEAGITATPLDVTPLRLAPGYSYSFWMPVLLESGGKFFVTYPEPRRQGFLTELGMKVVMSAQHERFRAMGSDLADIGLQVWRYANTDDRKVVVHEGGDLDLIPYADLVSETTGVYQILASLVAERDEALKRASYGRRGSLL